MTHTSPQSRCADSPPPDADKVDYGQPEGGTSMSSQTPGDLRTAVMGTPTKRFRAGTTNGSNGNSPAIPFAFCRGWTS
jgi:hypothetical protein